jgi:AcrR family transcriptional regulator
VDKREQIIVSAMQLLVENGEQSTPMSAIAREANVGMGTIYNYFPTKDDLINEIYLYIKISEVRAISKPCESDSIRHCFEQFYSLLLTYLVDNPLHFRFMDQFQSAPVIVQATRDAGNAAFALYIELLHTGQRQGIIKPIAIEEIMQFVNGGLMGFVRWLLVSNRALAPALLHNQLRIAWDAIKE